MSTSTYTTKQGDTWDLIAYRLYPDVGGEMCLDRLMEANWDYIDVAIFPAGVKLNVPEIEISGTSDLPPWKS